MVTPQPYQICDMPTKSHFAPLLLVKDTWPTTLNRVAILAVYVHFHPENSTDENTPRDALNRLPIISLFGK